MWPLKFSKSRYFQFFYSYFGVSNVYHGSRVINYSPTVHNRNELHQRRAGGEGGGGKRRVTCSNGCMFVITSVYYPCVLAPMIGYWHTWYLSFFFTRTHFKSWKFYTRKMRKFTTKLPKTVFFWFFWNFFTLSQKFYTHGVRSVRDKYQVCLQVMLNAVVFLVATCRVSGNNFQLCLLPPVFLVLLLVVAVVSWSPSRPI